MLGKSSVTAQLEASQEGLSSEKLVIFVVKTTSYLHYIIPVSKGIRIMIGLNLVIRRFYNILFLSAF
jgi:hypothetical protein